MEKGYLLLFSGRVQGVGFRYTAQAQAHRHGVCGWVRNRNDGGVELYMQGEKNILEDFLDDITREFKDAIREVERRECPITPGCNDFTIRF